MAILDSFKLDGKVAVVTGLQARHWQGAGRGLAEAGADIVGVSKSLEPSGSEVGKAVVQAGRKFHAYQCDFRKRKAVHEFTARVMADFPVIDILVANAGTIRRTPATEHPDENWDEVIEVNLNSQFVLSRDLGKRMVERGSGKIIFIASLLSFQGEFWSRVMPRAKGAWLSSPRRWPTNGRLRACRSMPSAPGYIATDMNLALQTDPERNPAILSRIPAGRWGSPEDLQGAVVFLASPASDYVSGTLLTVDGGWMAR